MSFQGATNATLGDLPVLVEYEGVYEPARLSGPPEDCYPDGSELYVIAVKVMATGDDLFDYLSADTIKKLEEQCWEEFFEDREAA